jgi:carbonic anhydrase
MTRSFVFATLLCFFAVLCGAQNDFTYDDAGTEGPANWGDATLVNDADPVCTTGSFQSPINIIVIATEDGDFDPIEVREFAFLAELDFNDENNNLQIEIPAALQSQRLKGGPLEFDDDNDDNTDAYNLLRVQVHSPCMNLINGRLCDVELLYIFQRDDQDFNTDGQEDLAIVSLQFNTPVDDDDDTDDLDDDTTDDDNDDEGENDFIEQITEAAEEAAKPAALDGGFAPFNGFPAEDRSFYSYKGSLPFPPCTENVDWIVFSDQQEISRNQIAAFTDALPDFVNDRKNGNTRDVAGNSFGREVFFTEVIEEESEDNDYFF